MKNTYMPSEEILEKYAKVLVNFALGGGKGIKKGDVVWLRGNESCKPLYVEVYREILRKGAHIIPTYSPSELPDLNLQKDFYQLAREHQINFFPEHYMKGLIKQVDHMLMILCEEDMRGLSGRPRQYSGPPPAAGPGDRSGWRSSRQNYPPGR